MIIAHQTGAPQMMIDVMAGAFIVARIVHGICYITDRSTARSFVWLAGFFLTLGLFLIWIAVVVLVARRNKIEFLVPLVPELERVLSEVQPGEIRQVTG